MFNRGMFRVFSGGCLSLEDMETVLRANLVERPHVLGPGADYFTVDGEPVRPPSEAHTLQKVFSGSALDLNACSGETYSDEDMNSPMAMAAVPGSRPALPVSVILNQLSTETEKERAKSAKSKINILVIAENGYIGSHVVVKLLEAGYSVRLAVSNLFTPQQQSDFYAMMGRDVALRLSIVNADITNSCALRDTIRGCRYIIHCGCSTASSMKGQNPVTYHIEAIQALFDGIRLSGKATVKRVVLTGAASSVFHIKDTIVPSGNLDESCWNTVATAESDPVIYAKIIFEKEAWRLAQLLGVELVVLLPSIVIGPSRIEETSEAMLMMIQELANVPSYFPFCPNLYWNYVDVRDVAEAHLRAIESPGAKDQRIIVSCACLSLPDISKIIKKRFSHLTPPTRCANTLLTLLIGATSSQGVNLRFLWRNLGVRKALDNHRAIEVLGMKFTDINETIGVCVEEMIAAGEVPAPQEVENNKLSRAKWQMITLCAVGATGIFAIAWFYKRN